MLVRPLRPADIDNVMILMNYYRDHMEIADDEWDEDSVIQSIKMFASNQQCVALVALEGYKIIGLLLGSVKKEFHNKKYLAAVQMFYFLPGHATNENYRQIYAEFKQWYELANADRVILLDITDNTDSLIGVKDLLDFDTKTYRLFIKEEA